MLWFIGLQRVGHDWVTELSWTETASAKQNKLSVENNNFAKILHSGRAEIVRSPWKMADIWKNLKVYIFLKFTYEINMSVCVCVCVCVHVYRWIWKVTWQLLNACLSAMFFKKAFKYTHKIPRHLSITWQMERTKKLNQCYFCSHQNGAFSQLGG